MTDNWAALGGVTAAWREAVTPLTFVSLFAGIGGLDLGLERAGMRCVGQVEIDEYATRVLAKHWPDVPRWRDVRDVGAHNLPACDLICGGFPCQDISEAGKREGLTGKRSGLWSEFARLVGEVRPRFVLVENVADLLVRGVDRVLGDLAALGYDAEWSIVSACAVGAPHTRERLFIVAYRDSIISQRRAQIAEQRWADSSMDAYKRHWATEPDVGRVVYGVPARVDRLRGLGNAVVPQVAEYIGQLIIAHAAEAPA
jgi:DNA (cytosine-5)-methyltransferase 1